MAVLASEVKWVKSEIVTDTSVNGGRASHIEVVHGAKNNLFPRVTKANRIAGITRYRKEFASNENGSGDVMYAAKAYLETPSNGGDVYRIGAGTQIDTQAAWASELPIMVGVGALNAILSGGESSIDIMMDDTDIEFVPGGFVHIADKVSVSQTIGTGDNAPRIGDSVQETTGTWNKIAATEDNTYPKGTYLGSNAVFTERTATKEEFLQLTTGLTENEVLATGDGADASPTLSALAAVTNGLVTKTGYRPVITATCGSVLRTVNVAADGTCSGYCTAGQLNMADGTWTTPITPITFTTAPDNATNITITYYDKNYSYAGNVVTISLSDTVSNSYATDGTTFVSGCIPEQDVEPAFSAWSETGVAGTGTFDITTYPLTLHNDGAEYDTWTIRFTSSSAFSLSGTKSGSNVATGTVGSDFSPTNPATGQPFFELNHLGWSGTFQTNDQITFTTHRAALPVVVEQDVPAGTAAVDPSFWILGLYWE